MSEQPPEEIGKIEGKNPLRKLPRAIRRINPFKPKVSQEELKEFDEKAKTYLQESEVQTQIEERLEDWLTSARPDIDGRTNTFGVEKTDVDNLFQNLINSFKEEFPYIRNPKLLEELKSKTKQQIQQVRDENIKDQLESEVNSITPLSLLQLIDKSLSGQQITTNEKIILDTLQVSKEGQSISGSHDPFLPENIKVHLLGPNSLKDYTVTLHHEFTHYAFSKNVKKGNVIEIIKPLAENADPEKIKAQRYFAEIITAINESCAHRSGKYFGGNDPAFSEYSNKVHPRIFRGAYEQIDQVANGKSINEFDHSALQIYKHFVDQWNIDLTMAQMQEAVSRTFQEELSRHRSTNPT